MGSIEFMPPESSNTPVRSRLQLKAETHERVIAKARALFLKHGFDGVTIRDIAEAAHVSSGTVSSQYGSKSALFSAVLRDAYDKSATLALQADEPGQAVARRLSSMFAALYDFHFDGLDIMRAAILAGWQSAPETRTINRDALRLIRTTISNVLEDGVRSGELMSAIDSRLAAETLMDLYVMSYQRAILNDEDASATKARFNRVIILIVGGLRALPTTNAER
jgi:AcrR family transcriptional regulator